jgi:predicted dehydrogenase
MRQKHVLVIGGGSIGERHVRCFLRSGRAKVSLCEVRDDVRDRLSNSYELQAAYNSLEAALGSEFDAAVICTPAHLHVPMAIQLGKRGICLLIEKPLSISCAGIDELLAVRDSGHLVVAVAYVLRHHPAMKALKLLIESCEFGRPVELIAQSGQHFPLYRPGYLETYYTQHQTGGGAIQDALTHMMNAVEWLVGPVTQLVADAEHCVLDGVTVEDTVHVLTRHNSILGCLSLNQHQMPRESHFSVICDGGALRADLETNQVLVSRQPGCPWEVVSEFQLERDELFVEQADAFLDAVDGKTERVCSLEDGIQTLKANLATLRSVELKQWVNVINE